MNEAIADPKAPNASGNGADGTLPFAVIAGSPLDEVPQDLYIPPNALRVFLETFEGPLDLLLYLIRAQDLDILTLPIAKITTQYMEYVEMMKTLRIELAAEYMLMAAILAEIKSRMLLPQTEEHSDDEDDPRRELIRRLLEYERYKKAAEHIEEMPRSGRDNYAVAMNCDNLQIEKPLPKIQLKELVIALQRVIDRVAAERDHRIVREPLPVQDRIAGMLRLLHSGELVRFEKCFTSEEGVAGVIVSFLALLNLLKVGMVVMVQSRPYAPIYLRSA